MSCVDVSQGGSGKAGFVQAGCAEVRLGLATRSRKGSFRRGVASSGWSWRLGQGKSRFGLVRSTMASQDGLGSIRSVWVRHVAVRYVTAVKVIRVMLSHGVFRSVKLRQPRWGIMQIPRHLLTLIGEEDGRKN